MLIWQILKTISGIKKKRQLYFVDLGASSGRFLYVDLIKHFLTILEMRHKAIDSTIFENFIDQYFGLLFNSPYKEVKWVRDFEKDARDIIVANLIRLYA